MIRKKRIKIVCSSKWDDISDYLREYRVDETLKRINRESYDLLFNLSNSSISAIKQVEFSLCPLRIITPEKHEVYITAWTLIDFAYYLIKASNDYRGKIIEGDKEFYALYSSVNNYIICKEDDFVDGMDSNDPEFFMFLWGFMGEQLKHEDPGSVLVNLSRELYIFLDINDSKEFDVEEILLNETGLSWQGITAFLFIAWYRFQRWDSLKEISEKTRWKNEADRKEFEKIVERYTTDYKDIRESKLERQWLYSKPYVKTQKGEVVSVSAYLNWFLCEHCIFWIIRDRYNRLGSQDFTNYFGVLFEKYVEELFRYSLKQNEYEKIAVGKSKRADWRLNIGNHRILIEQKSTIMQLAAKQQQTDLNAVGKFAIDTLIKAIRQLENTETEYDDGKYIKIILLYEDYLDPALLDAIMNMPECKIENDHYFWIVTINEMEMLLYTAKTDRQLFDTIIKEKKEAESNHFLAGKSLVRIMREKGVNENVYLKQEKIRRYRDELQEVLKSII